MVASAPLTSTYATVPFRNHERGEEKLMLCFQSDSRGILIIRDAISSSELQVKSCPGNRFFVEIIKGLMFSIYSLIH